MTKIIFDVWNKIALWDYIESITDPRSVWTCIAINLNIKEKEI